LCLILIHSLVSSSYVLSILSSIYVSYDSYIGLYDMICGRQYTGVVIPPAPLITSAGIYCGNEESFVTSMLFLNYGILNYGIEIIRS